MYFKIVAFARRLPLHISNVSCLEPSLGIAIGVAISPDDWLELGFGLLFIGSIFFWFVVLLLALS
jgi:hypothetical protein